MIMQELEVGLRLSARFVDRIEAPKGLPPSVDRRAQSVADSLPGHDRSDRTQRTVCFSSNAHLWSLPSERSFS